MNRMQVDLRELQSNPTRDFIVDPIDEEVVKTLTESIQDAGFWGGVLCRRKNDGTMQIVAGHHRIRAAIAAGLETADLCVGNGTICDADMARLYALENATQRGNTGTAQVGSVAAALRHVAKTVLGGISGQLAGNGDINKIRGNLTSEKGIGRDVILDVLHDVPGINDKSVKQALVNLKEGGSYARIIAEVQAEIERENAEAYAALERAEREREEAEEQERKAVADRKEAVAKEKAATAAADRKRAEEARQKAEADAKLAEKRRKEADESMKQFDAMRKTRDDAAKATEASARKEKTWDFEGVSKYLKNAHQIDVFRDAVIGEGIRPYLPVEGQAKLAKHIVDLAKKRNKELTGTFIKENVIALVLDAKGYQRQLSKQEQEELRRADLKARTTDHIDGFCHACRNVFGYGDKILRDMKEWPKDQPFPSPANLRKSVEAVKQMADTLLGKL